MSLLTNLRNHWKLNDDGTWADSHGSDTLTETGMVGASTGHVYSLAADFPGTSGNYLSVAAAVGGGDNPLTISAWVFLDAVTLTAQLIYVNSSSSLSYRLMVRGNSQDGDTKPFFTINDIGGDQVTATWGSNISVSTWYRIVGQFDPIANTVSIIVNNGTPVSTSTGSFFPRASVDEFTIASNQLDGRVGPVDVWNRVLSDTELDTHYNSGAGLIYASYGGGDVAFDAASNSGYQAASSNYSWSHTCTGSDRYLIVGISMLSISQTVTVITYNGVSLTLLGVRSSVTGACRVELWGMVAPSTGSNTISVTLSGSIASAGCASSYTGVHQTSPTEDFESAQATNVGAADAAVNVTSVADNDWVVDIVATDDTAITVGAGQTERANVTGAGGSGAMSSEGPKTPAGSVTMSWANVGALATWAIAATALRPVSASSLFVFNAAWTRTTNILCGCK